MSDSNTATPLESPFDLRAALSQLTSQANVTSDNLSQLTSSVDQLSSRFDILIRFMMENTGLHSGDEDDLKDMRFIIKAQNNIIQALVSDDGLSEDSRNVIRNILSSSDDFNTIEDCQERIARRSKERMKVQSGVDSDA